MIFTGKGIEDNSHIYFCSFNSELKNFLLYPLVVGKFKCNEKYNVSRENYNSYLLIYIKEGKLYLDQDGHYCATKNQWIIIDCYKKHRYYTDSTVETYWCHFDGINAKLLYEKILESKQKVFDSTPISFSLINQLIDEVKKNDSDYDISSTLYSLICELGKSYSIAQSDNNYSTLAAEAVEYLTTNYKNNIKIKNIAIALNISSSLLFKIFKKTYLMSPYDYLLKIRLDNAKKLLRIKDMSISEVAENVGFNSEENFIYFFKKHEGISPLKFRKINY